MKILNGSRADRINADAPQGQPGAPECPPHVREDTEAKAEWERIVPELEELGVLATVDGAELGLYCLAHATMVRAERDLRESGLTVPTANGGHKTNPAVNVARDARAQCHRFLIEFGCTPSARSRVKAASKPKGPVDQFEAFMQSRRGG